MTGNVAVFAPNLTLTITMEAGEGDASELHLHPGGQGFWVSRMLSHLGVTPMLCGPIGGETGMALSSLLRLWEIELHPIETALETPAVIQDRRSGERVPIAETSPHGLDRHSLDDTYTVFFELALAAGVAVITGQTVEVVPLADYRRLAHDLASTDVLVVGDLHGHELAAYLDGGGLDILKVSDEDLASDGLLDDADDDSAVSAIESLGALGARNVVLSRADRPTIARLDGRLYFATSPRLEPADFRGAGDSMTAGLAVGLMRGLGHEELLRLACGAGSANVTRHGLGSGSEELIAKLGERVEIDTVERAAG